MLSFQGRPFIIEAFTDNCDAKLKVIALEAAESQLEQAVCNAAITHVSNTFCHFNTPGEGIRLKEHLEQSSLIELNE